MSPDTAARPRVCYVCKYTPVELIAALGGDPFVFDTMPAGFDRADGIAHPNLCGFGKAVIEAVLSGQVRELVLVNCCDTIRSVYDILEAEGSLRYLAFVDMLRDGDACTCERTAAELTRFARHYTDAHNATFDPKAFRRAFSPAAAPDGPYIGVLGARMGNDLFSLVERSMPMEVRNETCVNNRSIAGAEVPATDDFDELMAWYATRLLRQTPCMRMTGAAARRALVEDPNLAGVVYHTIKFCDFYGFEYAELKERLDVPMVKIESDFSLQSSGQLSTRLEAFAEGLEASMGKKAARPARPGRYFVGIDSGSTSTDVVVMDASRSIVCSVILPTGAGAAAGADRALEAALSEKGIDRNDIAQIVATGYGRQAIGAGDASVTEITCHARGAHYLNPKVRTVVDIGGQDSKAIALNEDGSVANFAMNDKCAAGTGRFLEMMARTLEMSLDELSRRGLSWHEDIAISSMCTVFAESEIVSLIAQNKATDDIVHGLNKAVAAKTASLVKRVGGRERYMMTGGVSKNEGVVKALEESLGAPLEISDKAQLAGAIGAALFAVDFATEA